MLLRLTDKKGRDTYVNPVYIKKVKPKGDGCEVHVSNESFPIKVEQSAEELVRRITELMPVFQMPPLMMEDEIAAQRAAAAAAG